MRLLGLLAMAGGALGLALAPPLVAIKYMTGWAIVPEPFWVPAARASLAAAFPAATPAELWTGFGTAYSIALALILGALGALAPWVAWMFVLVFPAALFASGLLLPTTPSGALWLFSLLMALCGYWIARGRGARLVTAA